MAIPDPNVHVVEYWPSTLPEVKEDFTGTWRETMLTYGDTMFTPSAAANRARVKGHVIADYIERRRIGWIRFSNGRLLVRASDIEAIRRIRATYGLPLFPARYEDLHDYAAQFGTDPDSSHDEGVTP